MNRIKKLMKVHRKLTPIVGEFSDLSFYFNAGFAEVEKQTDVIASGS